MSQEKVRRSQPGEKDDPIRYGDVFGVSGELSSQPIAPQDAAMMQTAENLVLGQTQKGGPAAVMQSAATRNERAGLVGHNDVTGITGEQGVTVTETDIPGVRIVTESVAGQVIGQDTKPAPVWMTAPSSALDQGAVTIGEALEAAALTAGDKPVDESDAAAIQAAEMRATGRSEITPGGVAASAQSAASVNASIFFEENKATLGDILKNATGKMPADKVVTGEDAEGVISAELRNNPSMTTHPGGVADTLAAAARVNQSAGTD